MAVYNIIYFSKSIVRLEQQELLKILNTSRDWNESHEITGMLVYLLPESSQAGRFMQVIEGHVDEIKSLFEKIKTDSRHHQVTLLHEGFIGYRSFDKWAMGFNILNESSQDHIPGYISPQEIIETHQQEGSYNIALNFLKSFYSMK